jgi:tRNA-splicing ligase RtcB (3'-phosphate/5'-hydroxy nucleic acid ligase)
MPTKIENILNWASEVDDNTIEQAGRASRLPFVAGHIALMPDAHFGYGSTVGSVIPTQGAIIPSAIGVDIGCGMIAAELNLTSNGLPDNLGALHGKIREVIPAGMGAGHDHNLGASGRPGVFKGHWPRRDQASELSTRQVQKAIDQFGSLGGGNHFVEVCLDERDVVWIVLHSGSRGIGNELANVHIDGAKALMKRYFIELEDADLAYLVEGTPEFDAYIADMLWAQDYAMGNREVMMDAAVAALQSELTRDRDIVIEVGRINCHHNYTEMENHLSRNVWLTRKGAIRARVGDLGVIPGSMGTRSYIVSGLGNPASYQSCSHGAGRRLSRGGARRSLDVDGLREAMNGKTWNDRDAEALLDEDPRAYKSIDQVMADQADLVQVEHELTQILNYKGVETPRRKRRHNG